MRSVRQLESTLSFIFLAFNEQETVSLIAFEHECRLMVEVLRHGEVNDLEKICEAVETYLFHHLIDCRFLARLAEGYPTT